MSTPNIKKFITGEEYIKLKVLEKSNNTNLVNDIQNEIDSIFAENKKNETSQAVVIEDIFSSDKLKKYDEKILLSIQEEIKKFDSDSDGKINKEEYSALYDTKTGSKIQEKQKYDNFEYDNNNKQLTTTNRITNSGVQCSACNNLSESQTKKALEDFGFDLKGYTFCGVGDKVGNIENKENYFYKKEVDSNGNVKKTYLKIIQDLSGNMFVVKTNSNMAKNSKRCSAQTLIYPMTNNSTNQDITKSIEESDSNSVTISLQNTSATQKSETTQGDTKPAETETKSATSQTIPTNTDSDAKTLDEKSNKETSNTSSETSSESSTIARYKKMYEDSRNPITKGTSTSAAEKSGAKSPSYFEKLGGYAVASFGNALISKYTKSRYSSYSSYSLRNSLSRSISSTPASKEPTFWESIFGNLAMNAIDGVASKIANSSSSRKYNYLYSGNSIYSSSPSGSLSYHIITPYQFKF